MGVVRGTGVTEYRGPFVAVTSRSLSGTTLITAVGDLDIASSDYLADSLARAVDGGARHILLDFSEVTFLDCAGWECVRDAGRSVDRNGGAIEIIALSSASRRFIELSGKPLGIALPTAEGA